jgi:PHD/YefM family antitoxin component YafN of YafNO toxin-antitoxin module
MGEPPLNVLRSAELKRNRPAAVVLSANDYQRLQRSAAQPDRSGPSCLEWLLELPAAAAGRSREAIDADLNEQRDW